MCNYQHYIRDSDLKKIIDLGGKVYDINVKACIIRELQPDLGWKVIKRRRAKHKIEKDFKQILKDPMAIGV
jgi:hypothetical protein